MNIQYEISAVVVEQNGLNKISSATIHSTKHIKRFVLLLIEDVDGYAPTPEALDEVTTKLLIHREASFNNIQISLEVY